MAAARLAGLTLGLALCACAAVSAPEAPLAQTVEPAPAAPLPEGKLADYLAELHKASCPEAKKKVEPDDVGITALAVPLRRFNTQGEIGELTYAGGFSLNATETRFGGLSGLDVRDDGGLLAVSDEGAFVWIDLAEDGVTPTAARLGSLKDAKGEPLDGKREADAEGLALLRDLALVSFERDHRVLAYDIEACGAAARGVPVAQGSFSGPLEGIATDSNSGPEGLAATEDAYLMVGVETLRNGKGPTSLRPLEDAPVFDLDVGDATPSLVGLDILPEGDAGDIRAFSLHRSGGPGLSAQVVIMETRFHRIVEETDAKAVAKGDMAARSRVRFEQTSARKLATLGPVLFNFDNFEGIAATKTEAGVRLYIVSDNNFSASQRTLLMAFDLKGN